VVGVGQGGDGVDEWAGDVAETPPLTEDGGEVPGCEEECGSLEDGGQVEVEVRQLDLEGNDELVEGFHSGWECE